MKNGSSKPETNAKKIYRRRLRSGATNERSFIMKHEALEYLKEMLEHKYGDLTDDCGCYLRNEFGEPEWFSVAAIVELIDRADEEC